MKTILIASLVMLGSLAQAAQTLCGRQVSNNDVIYMTSENYTPLNALVAIVEYDKGTAKLCLENNRAIALATFPDGEIRAYIY